MEEFKEVLRKNTQFGTTEIWWKRGIGDYIRYGIWREDNGTLNSGYCCWLFKGPVLGWFSSFNEAKEKING